MSDIKGAMIQEQRSFDAILHQSWRSCGRLRQRGVAQADLPTEPRPGSAYIDVAIERRISWDYGS